MTEVPESRRIFIFSFMGVSVMSKLVRISAVALWAAGFSMSSFAVDVARVSWVSASPAAKTVAILAGQTGDEGNPYLLNAIGTAPTSVNQVGNPFSAIELANFSAGTDLVVSLDIPQASPFIDFVKFTIPATSSATTSAASFNIQVFSTIISNFTAFSVKLYSGNINPNPAPNSALSELSYGGNAQVLPTTTGSFTDQLTAGNYYIRVAGQALGFSPTYELQIVATPVPEPGTYAMLLAGLAAVGFVAKRRSI